jgi:hypothetical protein
MATQLREILDRIRMEAGIKGPDTLAGFLIHTFNAVVKEYTARRRFDQLFMARAALGPSGPGSGLFALPIDLQVLQKKDFYFNVDGNYEEAYPLYYSGDFIGSSSGLPNRVFREGSNLRVYPFSDTTVNSLLFYNYWRYPNPLTGYTSTLELPELEETVIKECIARVSRQGSTDLSAQYIREANRSYMASFGVDAQR